MSENSILYNIAMFHVMFYNSFIFINCNLDYIAIISMMKYVCMYFRLLEPIMVDEYMKNEMKKKYNNSHSRETIHIQGLSFTFKAFHSYASKIILIQGSLFIFNGKQPGQWA